MIFFGVELEHIALCALDWLPCDSELVGLGIVGNIVEVGKLYCGNGEAVAVEVGDVVALAVHAAQGEGVGLADGEVRGLVELVRILKVEVGIVVDVDVGIAFPRCAVVQEEAVFVDARDRRAGVEIHFAVLYENMRDLGYQLRRVVGVANARGVVVALEVLAVGADAAHGIGVSAARPDVGVDVLIARYLSHFCPALAALVIDAVGAVVAVVPADFHAVAGI